MKYYKMILPGDDIDVDTDHDDDNAVAIIKSDDGVSNWRQVGQAMSNGADWRDVTIDFLERYCKEEGEFCLWDDAEEIWVEYTLTDKGWIEVL